MALQVWLPLTKDLRNQGLDNPSITTVNCSLVDGGKMGKCLKMGYTNSFTVPSLVNKKQISFCFWIKVNTATSNNFLDTFRWYTSDGSTTYTNRQELFDTCTDIGLWYAGGSNYSASVTVGEWAHFAATIDYSTGKSRLYKNGELIKEKADVDIAHHITGANIQICENGLDVSYNDVRIYDHCLTPEEVKRIARGLILHYPLNRNGWGQENLLPVSGSTIINSTQSFEFQGWVQNFYTKTWMNEHLTPGKQYILSYTVTCLSTPSSPYVYKENRASPILVHQGVGWNQVTTTNDGIKDTNMSVGQSRDYKCTFTFATASESYEYYGLCGYTALYRDSSNNIQYAKFRIDNFKLEEGSIATPWCPNSSDTLATTMGLNSTIEYDCSGFCNNGTRTGTFSWTSDTPKYAVSTKFNGTEYMVIPFTCGSISDAVTVACWGYENNWNTSSAERLIGAATNSSGWCIGDYGSENTLFAFYANGGYNVATGFKQLTAGWHHFVITFDGLNLKYYVDGQQFSSKTFSTKQVVTGNYNINIGRHYGGSYSFKGNMSDVRVYATALSATDVKSLYQNEAYIDSSGNIYGKIR